MMKFKIPENVSDYMQRLAFEKMAREDVIDRILTSHKDDVDGSVLEGEPFKHYMSALIEVTAEYEMAKDKIPSYFPDNVPNNSVWSLDFDTCMVTIDA